MIPNIVHFIFGFKNNYGYKNFSFINFLAIYTSWKVNRPEKIYFHYEFEPAGEWWELSKPYLTLNKINAPNEIFENELKHFAHKADVVRLEMLIRYGGIYLDIDTICINSFKPLLKYDCVMGIEPEKGLCNAVILANSKSEFLRLWYQDYKNFNGNYWNYHSVIFPLILAKQYPTLIHIENKYSFFYPMYNDPVNYYLWHYSFPPFRIIYKLLKELIKNTHKFIIIELSKKGSEKDYTFHFFHGRKWHFNKLFESYCMHLWESYWWDPYLKDLSPDTILNNNSNFSMLIKKIISKEELQKWLLRSS